MTEQKYVVLKLATGEDVIGVVYREDADGYLIVHPMHIQAETDMEHHVEQYWAQPLCPFSDEREYFVQKRYIMYIKPLSRYLVPFYHEMVQRFKESEIIKNARQRAEGKVSWGGKEITEEEAKRRIEEMRRYRQMQEGMEDDDTTFH